MSTSPPPKSLLPQQFYWDTSVAPGRVWAGVPLSVDPAGQQLVLDTGRAGAMIGTAAPGNVPGPLWWDSNSGQLFIQYNDGNSTQWVSANSIDASTLEGSFLPITGGTVTGPTTFGGPPAGSMIITPIATYGALPTSTSLAQVESILNLGQGHGGNNFNPFFAGRYTSTVYGSLDMSAVGLLGAVSFAGTGGVGQHTGVQAYANRYNIIAQPTTTVAATLGAPANTISIADVSMFQYDAQPVLINGTGYLQVAHSGTSGAGTISVERNIPVTDGTLGRVVTGNNNPQMWGLNINVNDDASNTGMTSSKQSSYTLGCELDFRCSGIDDAGPLLYGSPSGIRHMMTLIGLGGTVGNPAEIGDGIFLAEGGGTHISWKRCFSVGNAAFSQSAFDTRLARQGTSANAIWLGDDHRIALDTNALWTLSANSASAMTINGTAGGTVNFKAGAATWASITAQGVTVSASAPGGVFYGAVPVGEQAFIALGWNGSNVTGYVNGTAVGGFAKIADLGGYLPLATGGTVGGTVSINALTGGWGANNWGKQLLVTVAAATTHPAIAITDVNGVNAWGIANLVGELDFAVMPAYSNSSTAPNKRLQLTATGMGFNGTAPIAKPTGVAVTIAAVHAALVSYGLIAP